MFHKFEMANCTIKKLWSREGGWGGVGVGGGGQTAPATRKNDFYQDILTLALANVTW